MVERQIGETAQDVKEHRAEWQADKAERQDKEKIEQAYRKEKELTETIAAGETDINYVEGTTADTLQLSRTDMSRKRSTTRRQAQVA